LVESFSDLRIALPLSACTSLFIYELELMMLAGVASIYFDLEQDPTNLLLPVMKIKLLLSNKIQNFVLSHSFIKHSCIL